MQNKYEQDYSTANDKEVFRNHWMKYPAGALRSTFDNYLIMTHVCEYLYENDPRCNRFDVSDENSDGRGADFVSEFIEEIHDVIQNEVEMIKRSKH